jgi:hypothetical protein
MTTEELLVVNLALSALPSLFSTMTYELASGRASTELREGRTAVLRWAPHARVMTDGTGGIGAALAGVQGTF